MTRVGVRQQRFRDGTGVQYMSDGIAIRCQAQGRTKMRQIREQRGNPDLTTDDIWPEAQCGNAALPGEYGCRWHPSTHGTSLQRRTNLHLIDYMPGNLRRKMLEMAENPDYIDRAGEIRQLLAMNAELFESMKDDEMLGASETWGVVENGLKLIEKGDVSTGVFFIKDAIQSTNRKYETYGQIRENIKLLDRITRTQVSTAKEMQNMATTEQIAALLERVFQETLAAVDLVVEDAKERRRLLRELGTRYDIIASAGDGGTLIEIS